MSDEWIFYPCQMGELAASIFFDHGIGETIDVLPLPSLLKVRVGLKSEPPTESTEAAYQRFCGLEDALRSVVQRHGGLYVGRVTIGGYRYLHLYTAEAEAAWSPRLRELGDEHGYEMRFMLRPDPNRTGYWDDLYPDEDGWQLIQDMRVVEALMREGDDGTASRPIEHWAYFPTPEIAKGYSEWLIAEGYRVDGMEGRDDGSHGVRFAHEGTVQLSDITRHTITLCRMAAEMQGEYDGWETVVCGKAGE